MDEEVIPDYKQVQAAFLAYMRDPKNAPPLADVALERLQVYRDIVYFNIHSFITNGFPVLHDLYDEDDWHALVADFIRTHRSKSPIFRKICEEFILFLQHERDNPSDPPFLLELAHYEWAEVVIERAAIEVDWQAYDSAQDLMQCIPIISPVAWVLQYQFPVHQIGEDFQPQQPGETPTFLVIYRNANDEVKFMELNAISARLVQILQQQPMTGEQALQQIITELPVSEPALIMNKGQEVLSLLRKEQIILGT